MAKALEQLYEEILDSEELKNELAEMIKNGDSSEFKAFLDKNDCHPTREEFLAFKKEKMEEIEAGGELTPEELEAASGGSAAFATYIVSMISAEGAGVAVSCAVNGAVNDTCGNGGGC